MKPHGGGAKAMAEKKTSSRERIVSSALALFSAQGITATTTKQIAEQAEVNEVTLFRQFGSKQGLLLAVVQEAPILDEMQAALTKIADADEPLKAYGALGLSLLGSVPELVRSLIGEAGQSPAENLAAISHAMHQANQQTVAYLQNASLRFPAQLSVDAGASLLNTLILGRAIMEFTSGEQRLWQSQTEFLADINRLFSPERSSSSAGPDRSVQGVADLSAETVRSLLQKAKNKEPKPMPWPTFSSAQGYE
ncbi:MAG: TetR/AcrR family transcriptional regulator [Phormidesmis sp. RL_2_1]|nr:TetR/AcrR family transcriptional regulator [Phormidesmis sp. RL_2_1]